MSDAEELIALARRYHEALNRALTAVALIDGQSLDARWIRECLDAMALGLYVLGKHGRADLGVTAAFSDQVEQRRVALDRRPP